MSRSPLVVSASSRSLTVTIASIFLLLLACTGCTQSREILGQAYVAPASLNVRSQLALKSGAVATLKHGDLVGVIDMQRRMVKIRTAAGFEGWVDSISLLSVDQMEQLRRERKAYALLPTEGAATAYETTNIHIAPSRGSPAFAQVPEGGAVSILGRKVAPKVSRPVRGPSLVFERPQAVSRKQRKEQAKRLSLRLPPKPAPPKAPANWQDLSAERIDGAETTRDRQAHLQKKADATLEKPAEDKKPVVREDWTLVRTKANDVGWVLTRNLLMSIPDEVAQYAEGKHITSFFQLGAVQDDVKGTKHNWLWTTGPMLLPYDFDSWRVFLWNRRRHRYETSYRQRDVEGYFPVHVDPVDAGASTRTFRLVMKDEDGKFRQRTYVFDGTRVRLTATEDGTPGDGAKPLSAGDIESGKLQTKLKASGWLKRKWSAIKQRFGGN
ncbi:MAG TPA: SH3 domain-containing protein [Bryobacteraceae bacterium]|nr:SH3 domain-containing protein [Bryobacteraceae bacterium]